MLAQRAEIKWLQLGDGNNAYFHATVKEKNKCANIQKLVGEDGSLLYSPEDIEKEVLNLYSKLVGDSANVMISLDIVVLREGAQITREYGKYLVQPVTDNEILSAIKVLG